MREKIGKKAEPEWAAKPERSNTLAIRFIVWVALTLGRRVARLFLYPICLYFLLFAGEARTASKKYLRKVLGRETAHRRRFSPHPYFCLDHSGSRVSA